MKRKSPRITAIVAVSMLAALCMLSPAALTGGRQAEEPGPPARHPATVKLPAGYRAPSPATVRFAGADIAVDCYAPRFSQGAAVYAEIYPAASFERNMSFEVKRFSFDGREIPASKRRWGYRALFGIHPEASPGKKTIRVVYEAGGMERAEDFVLEISGSGFPFFKKPLDLGKFSDVDYTPTPEEIAFINACAEKKKKAFGRTGGDLPGEYLSHPRNRHFITSPFWSKRLVMRYRVKNGKKTWLKEKLNIHRGIDLRGNTGDPVLAMADGEVVIAEPMYYEGNFIVLYHGSGVFSSYMHLDGVMVKEGDNVRAGSRIGTVGSTGQSTGAHLHVSLLLQGVSVDPLGLLSLPIRK